MDDIKIGELRKIVKEYLDKNNIEYTGLNKAIKSDLMELCDLLNIIQNIEKEDLTNIKTKYNIVYYKEELKLCETNGNDNLEEIKIKNEVKLYLLLSGMKSSKFEPITPN